MRGAEVETYGSFRMRAVGSASLSEARLFRAGELSSMGDIEARELSERFDVRLVCDLRSGWEMAASPSPAPGRFAYVAGASPTERRRKDADKRLVAGVIGEYGAPGERMLANYRRYVTGYPGIGVALRAIASEGAPALLHCVNGKDRTGVACAVLMRIAGFHPDDVTADYLATNAVNADLTAAEAEALGAGMTAHEREILMSFLEARPEYLEEFFAEADRAFGSFDAYVAEGLGLSGADRGVVSALLGR